MHNKIVENLISKRNLNITHNVPETSIANIDKVVQKLKEVVSLGKSVHIYGDYDVDGIFSVAQLYLCLKSLGSKVVYTLPNRYLTGYGLQDTKIFTEDVIVLVDTGITAIEQIKQLTSCGKEVIIIDHHLPKDELPKTEYIVNPKCDFDGYPFKERCAAGLLNIICKQLKTPVSEHTLDIFAMISTIADAVPLIQDNRDIVKRGLLALQNQGYLAIDILYSLLGKKIIDEETIAYYLVPCLNAPGRLGAPDIILEFLLSDNIAHCTKLALNIIDQNKQRKALVKKYIACLKDSKNYADLACIYNPSIPVGILGIIASRMSEQLKKPVLVTNGYRGSCRSVEGINIVKVLQDLSENLEVYGGHATAAGFTVKKDCISQLIQDCNNYKITTIHAPSVGYDAVLNISDINMSLLQALEIMKPFGPGNRQPVFKTENVAIESKKICGKNKDTLQIRLNNSDIQLIMFNCTEVPSDTINITYTIGLNIYNNKQYIQLNLQTIERRN